MTDKNIDDMARFLAETVAAMDAGISAEELAERREALAAQCEGIVDAGDGDGDDEGAHASEARGRSAPPKDNRVYSRQSYWDERFGDEESYEWLVGWSDLETSLRPHLREEDRILLVGCGNSSLSADLYDAGFHNITSIDFSAVLIEKMAALHARERPEMQWLTMDMCDLRFEDGSFDVVLDKAAMDAIMVDEGDVWDPAEDVRDKADRMCRSVSRVLRSGGTFLMVSFMQPHFRRWYLLSRDRDEASHREEHSAAYGWSIAHEVLDESGQLGNFLYVCRKV